jgi:hypothetical protein
MTLRKTRGRITAVILLASVIFCAFAHSVFCAEGADAFVSSVDAIKNSTTLNQEESRLAAAEALWEEYLASGGSALDPEVRDAYEDFTSLKAQIEASVEMCLTFMGYVEAARVAWETYSIDETKENLALATELLSKVDSSYVGIGNAKSTLTDIKEDVKKTEEPYIGYLQALNAALAAETYSAIKAQLNLAESEERRIQGMAVKLENYPGMEDADDMVAEINVRLGEIMVLASEFISAVGDIDYVDRKADILRAYDSYEGVDTTANGVSSTKGELDSIKKNYDGAADSSNSAHGDAESLVFSIIF